MLYLTDDPIEKYEEVTDYILKNFADIADTLARQETASSIWGIINFSDKVKVERDRLFALMPEFKAAAIKERVRAAEEHDELKGPYTVLFDLAYPNREIVTIKEPA